MGNEEYLVFLVSLVKVAYAMDEAKYFETVSMNIELRADRLDSFSRIGNFPLSLLANIAMVAIFFVVMWLLFPSLRNTVFVIFGKQKESSPSATYASVSQSELQAPTKQQESIQKDSGKKGGK